jgi:hypothetical protein
MKHIETTAWADFLMKDLFNVVKGSRLTKSDMRDGTIRHVGASRFNNGVTAMIGNKERIHPGNLLTVCYDGPVGTTFYQDEPFWATDAVNVLYPLFDLTEARAMFLIPVIQEAGSRFDYGEKWGMAVMKATPIKLPVTVDGVPDWEHMESSMTEVMTTRERALDILAQLHARPSHAINTVDWGRFSIGDLFHVIKGSRLTSQQREEGIIPYVGASSHNNGITEYIANDDHLHRAGTLTVCYNGPVGTTFYQPQDFWASDDVNVLYPKFEMSENIGLFFVPIIERLGSKYAYVDKWKQEDMRASLLPLPVDTAGVPDWKHMEETIKSLMLQREKVLDALVEVSRD